MKHHFLKENWHTDGNKMLCTYCHEPVDLKTEHHGEMHYKTAICKCGKKIILKVPFHGTGHDDFLESKLEEKLKA